jgi:hypothetical protein
MLPPTECQASREIRRPPGHPRGRTRHGALPFIQSAISRSLNSLSKILFIFPSRYLFAIGLPPVLSLRWNLPPALSCSPKQPDSKAVCVSRETQARRTGLSPYPACCDTLRRALVSLSSLGLTLQFATRAIFILGTSRFTRRYWGNPR